MERKFLEDLGLEKGTIDKIMGEHGKSVETEKGKTAAKAAELETANNSLKQLQETVKKYDGKDPDKLDADLKALQEKYNADVESLKLGSALDMAIVKSKAKNPKAVKALLNMEAIKLDADKLTGLEDQMAKLKESDAYLFEEAAGSNPDGENKPAGRVSTGKEHGGSPGSEVGADFMAGVRAGAGRPELKNN